MHKVLSLMAGFEHFEFTILKVFHKFAKSAIKETSFASIVFGGIKNTSLRV